jgi:hypothetical protein
MGIYKKNGRARIPAPTKTCCYYATAKTTADDFALRCGDYAISGGLPPKNKPAHDRLTF